MTSATALLAKAQGAAGRHPLRKGAGPRALVALASIAVVTLVAASATLGSESRGLARTQTVRLRIHWVDHDQAFFGDGTAAEMAGDSLRFHRLLVWRKGLEGWGNEIGPTSVHWPSLDWIHVQRGSQRHGRQGAVIGGLIGVALGVVGIAAFTKTPFGTEAHNRDAVWAVVGGGAFGAALGAGIGALRRSEKWEPTDPARLRELLASKSDTTTWRRR